MRRVNTRIVVAGLAAGFLGIALAQAAKADTIIFRSWETAPTTTFVEAPTTIERVLTRPVVVESAAACEKIIERPVMIERPVTIEKSVLQPMIIQQKDSHHLLNLKLF